MASEKVIAQKQEIVANLKEKLTGSVAGVLVDYKGINVAEDTKLRKELREAGVDYTVVKNTLLKFAIDEVGFGALDAHLSGTTALAVSKEDPVIAAKILAKYAEDSKGQFSIKAGFLDGEVIDSDKVIAVAQRPQWQHQRSGCRPERYRGEGPGRGSRRRGIIPQVCGTVVGQVRPAQSFGQSPTHENKIIGGS